MQESFLHGVMDENDEHDDLCMSDAENPSSAPLATVLRPLQLADFIGQEHLLGEGKALRQIIDQDRLKSLIFFGPPGTGKTTLAFIISRITESHFEKLNAVLSNVSELKKVLKKALDYRKVYPTRKFIVFLTRSTVLTRPSRTCSCRASRAG